MDNHENLVTEKVAENAEQTAEQTPKMYTEEEMNAKVNEIMGKKIARKTAKIEKEYARKYGELEEVLKAGTGEQDIGNMTNKFREFYRGRGIDIPDRQIESGRDMEVLARADAEEIISGGFEDVVEEVDRLADIGAANMTDREKAVFKILAEHRQNTERGNELAQIGVTEDVYNSNDFKEFSKKFNANTPIRDIYDIYAKTQPKKEIRTMGSMKNSVSADNGIKDFYTPEEARQFSVKDLNDNPALMKAIEDSMQRW